MKREIMNDGNIAVADLNAELQQVNNNCLTFWVTSDISYFTNF